MSIFAWSSVSWAAAMDDEGKTIPIVGYENAATIATPVINIIKAMRMFPPPVKGPLICQDFYRNLLSYSRETRVKSAPYSMRVFSKSSQSNGYGFTFVA